MKITKRIQTIPSYLFAEIEKKKQEALTRGMDIVNLGIGDPDLPTPDFIVESVIQAVQNPKNHDYPPYEGTLAFRKAVADWYMDRFGVELDAQTEVLSLIGSKEGIAHAFLTFLDPGDVAILPDPGYPVYQVNTLIAGGIPYMIPLKEENGYLLEFDAIDRGLLEKANLLFLNYPNNPTAAVATNEFLEQAVHFGRKHNLLICMDAAYSEVCYDGYKPRSILELKGAKDVVIEFHSLSKTFNMTGWRIGMAVGNKDAVQALGKIKTNIDSGIFKAIQEAGIIALGRYKETVNSHNVIYQKRRDIIVEGLNSLGWNVSKPKATFYIWAKVPNGMSSQEFTLFLLEKAGVLVVPGNGYGVCGEGYFRISITSPEEKLKEAVARIKKLGVAVAPVTAR